MSAFYSTIVKNKSILCLESHWVKPVEEPRPSIKPILQYASVGRGTSFAYHFLSTKEELVYWLVNTPSKSYDLLVLAFHGRPEEILIGRNQEVGLYLDELENIVGKKLMGKGLHFSSCSVLNTSKKRIMDFIKNTGASFVSGYAQGIDYIEGAVMDLAFLGRWYQYKRIASLDKSLRRSYGDFIRENKFKFYWQ